MTTRRRRPRGEGCVFQFRTKAGAERFGYKFTAMAADGRRRQVLRRRDENGQPWTARQDAADALREAIVKSARGSWVDPSRQPLGEYLSTWLDGLRLAPSTVASYRKNIRLHVGPYIGTLPLASLTSAADRAVPRAGGLRAPGPERRAHRAAAVAEDGQVHPHDHQRCAGRRGRGRGAAAGAQPGGEGQAAHGERS
jgi:Phage integrase, N-terminal SAM-like domain